jgi:hypothetical protein
MSRVTRWLLVALAMVTTMAGGRAVGQAGRPGAGVVVAWPGAGLPAGYRLTLHVETPSGERTETSFVPVTRLQLIAAEARRDGRRDSAASPTPAAGSMAHAGSSRSVAPPSPMAGSGDAHSGSSRASASPVTMPASLVEQRRASPTPAPSMAGSDHAHSGTSRTESPAAPAPGPVPRAAVPRKLGTHRVHVFLRIRPEEPVPPLEGVLVFAPLPPGLETFEGAIVLSGAGDPVNVRIQHP